MKRYISFETYCGKLNALTESESEELGHKLPDDVADWVWQYASCKFSAMRNHVDKHNRLNAILNAGLPMPRTIGD